MVKNCSSLYRKVYVMKFRFMILIGLVLFCGCTNKFYEREYLIIKPDNTVIYEHIKVKLDSNAVNAEANEIYVSNITDPNGTVTRTLSTGALKQDISEEALKTITESVVKSVITAITHIPQ